MLVVTLFIDLFIWKRKSTTTKKIRKRKEKRKRERHACLGECLIRVGSLLARWSQHADVIGREGHGEIKQRRRHRNREMGGSHGHGQTTRNDTEKKKQGKKRLGHLVRIF